jgi:hypothetical protein
LWTKAVAAEKRCNAQEARLIEISIPRALPRKHWVELARRLARVLAVRGMTVQVDIHCVPASDGGLNPHIHLMCTMREIVDGEFSSKKARHWNAYFYNNAKALRHDIAEMLNEFCRMKGVTYHADTRSNAERSLPPAEMTIPRWNILAYKRSGQKTPRWNSATRNVRSARKSPAWRRKPANLGASSQRPVRRRCRPLRRKSPSPRRRRRCVVP